MPELPEVETTLRGIKPHLEGQKVSRFIVRHHGLRWPVSPDLHKLAGQQIQSLERRAKYLLLNFPKGTLILHLGMSGSLRILTQDSPPRKHDHIDIAMDNHKILRFTDPRRFGACIFTHENIDEHILFKNLGPEPLEKNFSGEYLWKRAQKRKVAVKSFIMNNQTVVGVGNIYAAEALFAANIHPNLSVEKISKLQFDKLVKEIKMILRKAIQKGGTTLKDFVDSEGKPGYFSMHLKVYGRAGLPCVKCKTTLEQIRLGQRGTVFCSQCQKHIQTRSVSI
jgi:formamidopyrimidine-DNA glycosylase